MRFHKSLLTLVLSGILTVSLLAGCSGGGAPADTSDPAPAEGTTNADSSETESAQPEASTAESDPAETGAAEADAALTESNGGTLVVYYSASGNTEAVAGYIADALGADTFTITPAEPYSDADLDWTDDDSRVSREHNDESLRTMELAATTVDGWDSYDTVFLGYPIWWGIAAWPVDNFVSANDFTGKTVIPFCTSASSGLGESGELLADLAGTGEWQEGERFRSSADAETVSAWLTDLGLLP